MRNLWRDYISDGYPEVDDLRSSERINNILRNDENEMRGYRRKAPCFD